MRLVVMLLGTAVLLAGCSQAPADAPTPAPALRLVQLEPAILVNGTYAWHETGNGNPLEVYELASQAVAHPCIWDGPNGEEPYFNNRKVPTGDTPIAWSGNVTFTLEWTDEDWIGTALRIAYKAPGITGWHEAGPVQRGVGLVEPIVVLPRNGTEDDRSSDWSVWVCLPTDTGNPEQPFVGSFTARAAFVADPIPETLLAPEETEGRNSRPG